MSITVIREGNVLKIVHADGQLPAGEKFKLFTAEEIARCSGHSPVEFVQLESVFGEDDEDWGDSLASFRLPPLQLPSEDSNGQG